MYAETIIKLTTPTNAETNVELPAGTPVDILGELPDGRIQFVFTNNGRDTIAATPPTNLAVFDSEFDYAGMENW